MHSRAQACEVKMRSAALVASTAVDKAHAAAKSRVVTAALASTEEELGKVKDLLASVAKDKLAEITDPQKLAKEVVAEVEAKLASIAAAIESVEPQVVAMEKIFQAEARRRLVPLPALLATYRMRGEQISEDLELVQYHGAVNELREGQKKLGEKSLFAQLDKDQSGAITAQELASFWKQKGQKKKSDADVAGLLDYLSSDQGLRYEEFSSAVKDTFRCEKTIAVSDGFAIGSSKLLRTLDPGELCELVEGPQIDEATKVERVKVCMLKDKLVGWVTVTGNQGTAYLQQENKDGSYLRQLDQRVVLRRRQAAAKAAKAAEADAKTSAAVQEAAKVLAEHTAALEDPALDAEGAGKAAADARRAAMQVMKSSRIAQAACLKLTDEAGPWKEQLEKVDQQMKDLVQSANALPARVKAAEAERAAAFSAALSHLSQQARAKDGFAKSIAKAGKVTAVQLKRALKELSPDDATVKTLWAHFSSEESMDSDAFAKALRTFYKCVAGVGMSEGCSICKSKMVGSLSVGDIVEALGEHEMDEAAKVNRVQVKDKDGKVGWVTIKGNAGTVYLEHYKPDDDESAEPPAKRSKAS